jgi:conjugative transfer region lipoprotein (TIGR03751 family)
MILFEYLSLQNDCHCEREARGKPGYQRMEIKPFQNHWITSHCVLTTTLTLLLNLTGCTTCGNAIPNNEPTMAEIYETAMQQSHQYSLEQVRSQVKNNNTCCVSSDTDTANTFPTLPNPQLIMYVYPHFSTQDEAPIPGYTTTFNLYEKMYYAMEGEVKPNVIRN